MNALREVEDDDNSLYLSGFNTYKWCMNEYLYVCVSVEKKWVKQIFSQNWILKFGIECIHSKVKWVNTSAEWVNTKPNRVNTLHRQ